MSTGKCGTPACDLKNYDQCKISEDANNVCVISGTNSNDGATCTASGQESYLYDEGVCTSRFLDQSHCEEKYGCKWDYIPLTDSPLNMGCMRVDGNSHSCQNEGDLSRYSLKSKKTFGCDEEHCIYGAEKKTRENGVCVGVEDVNDPSCITLRNDTCMVNESCVWVSKDEAHCGYHRNIENYLHDSGGNINIPNDLIDGDDPCLRIKNPGREECEEQGCIWDIYGNRKVSNIYNDPTSTDVNENYYDINTSGLCIIPNKEACMNNFCYKESGTESPNYKLPDGICEYDGSVGCQHLSHGIVTERTPGLIDYRSWLPDSIEKTRNFHDSSGHNLALNRLLGAKYKNINESSGEPSYKKSRLLLEMNEIVKKNCELNLNYPGTHEDEGFPFDEMENKYDINTGTCKNGSSPSTSSINLDTKCSDKAFYHKDIGSENYAGVNSCEFTAPDTALLTAVIAVAQKNIVCRNLYYDLIEKIKEAIRVPTATTRPTNLQALFLLIDGVYTVNAVITLVPEGTILPAIGTSMGVGGLSLSWSTTRTTPTATSRPNQMTDTILLDLITRLTAGGISVNEYLNVLSRYLAGFITINNNSENCIVFDSSEFGRPGCHGCSAAAAAADKTAYAVDYPIVNDYVDITLSHQAVDIGAMRVKDMVYRKGKAVVTVQNLDSDGVSVTNTPLTSAPTLMFDNTPLDYLSGVGIDDTTIINYIGGIAEFEIDDVEPGCFPNDDGSESSKTHLIISNEFGDPINGWNVKEIRLKDVPMDIYFEQNINGLFKINDLISIEDSGSNITTDDNKSIVRLFNENNITETGADGKQYQKITGVDHVIKMITVENAKRRGPIFKGRADLEALHHGIITLRDTTTLGVVASSPAVADTEYYNDMITSSTAPTLISDTNSLYDITALLEVAVGGHAMKSGDLKDWRINYIHGGTTYKEGIIDEFTKDTTTYTIKIKAKTALGGGYLTADETGSIHILSFRPPHIYDYLKKPLAKTDSPYDIDVTLYSRNGIAFIAPTCTETASPSVVADREACAAVTALGDDTVCVAVQRTDNSPACTYTAAAAVLPTPSDFNTKQKCDFNNGKWGTYTCISGSTNKVRGADLCERTGFEFLDESNVCIKGINDDASYCSNKTTNGDTTPWDDNSSLKNPCGVCQFVETNNIQSCEPLKRNKCTEKNKSECDASNSCEYYFDNMGGELVVGSDGTSTRVTKAEFTCGDGPVGTTNSCVNNPNRNTLSRCEGSDDDLSGCEWKCPYFEQNIPGYEFSLFNGGSVVNTLTNDVDGIYYNPDDIQVECAEGWIPSSTNVTKAQCVVNIDENSNELHPGALGFVGCIKTLMCKNTEYTLGIVNDLMSSNPGSVPDIFKRNGLLDPQKIPLSDGSFKCPEPSSLIGSADNVEGWSVDACCVNTGLCTGNTNMNENVTCPSGQEIKKLYYEGSDELSSIIGNNASVCCIAPTEPTITVPLDGDYAELIGDTGSTISDEFRIKFIDDIVKILNESTNITVAITADMIEILDIEDGSVIVTFKIKKNTSGEVVLKEQISKTLLAGTQFTNTGLSMKGIATFKVYDPRAKYLYYSEKYKTGITLGELVIGVFVTFSLCFFCLVVLGMLFK